MKGGKEERSGELPCMSMHVIQRHERCAIGEERACMLTSFSYCLSLPAILHRLCAAQRVAIVPRRRPHEKFLSVADMKRRGEERRCVSGKAERYEY